MKSDVHFYKTITQPSSATFKDRGSKFIAYAYPVECVNDFKKYLQQLKKEHPKAVHHCYAYRIGLGNVDFRLNDDGEPSGTAGRPILGQIDSKMLTNVAVIVVRYWGGTLLGVPGLINAYKTAASLALQITPIVQQPVLKKYTLEFDYTQINVIMQLLKQYNCTILENEMQLFCRIVTGIPLSRQEEVLYKLTELHGIEIKTEK